MEPTAFGGGSRANPLGGWRHKGIMAKCWANSLGGCSNKWSHEHLVSQSLFDTDKILVQGFDWCKDEAREISLITFNAKILCTTHNSALSPIDSEAGRCFHHISSMIETDKQRELMKPHAWKVIHRHVHGPLLERWFLKTLINLNHKSNLPIGGFDSRPGTPINALTRQAFGLDSFPGKSGLYMIAHVGLNIRPISKVAFTPLIKDNRFIAGGLFGFYGFMFMIFLLPEGPPNPMSGLSFLGTDLGICQANYHNNRVNKSVNNYLSQVLIFDWSKMASTT
ncbi:MAG: hypothetical protein ACRDGA_03290 [Bacteroidota bacterium]